MKGLEEEIAKIEEQENQTPEQTNDETAQATEESAPEEVKSEENVAEEQQAEEKAPEEAEEKKPELTEEEKQAKYEQIKARRQNKNKAPESVAPTAPTQDQINAGVKKEQDEFAEMKAQMQQVQGLLQDQQYQNSLKAAGQEFKVLENDFKEAFDDYDDQVKMASELVKTRLMDSGLSEADALAQIEEKKLILAANAHAQGIDPVEAVYSEVKQINSSFEKFAEMNGYTKSTKPKTNMQALREINKPNAMSAGTGRDTAAVKTEFEEMDDSDMAEIEATTLGELGLKRR